MRRDENDINVDDKSFNPRTRKGCDYLADEIAKANKVSIHAPVKDATKGNSINSTMLGFNPRTRKGCD